MADVLQIAPNDHPPFGDILSIYERAFEHLGVTVDTLVLSPAQAAPLPGCTYLDLTDLARVRAAGRRLRMAVNGTPRLALCHRYRAYRVLRASGLVVPRTVALAHEFGFFKRFQRRLERYLFARDVLFAGVSPAVQAELARTVEDPLCLPNALDLETMRAACLSRADALNRLDVPQSKALTIGLVGRLVEKKSPELAIEAIRQLAADGETVRLLVIGDGPLREQLEKRAEGLPVTFLGFVPEANRLFKALDLLLLTSQEVEAFGMVALEAMSAGVPVVAGPTPGPQYVLGGTGFYYNQREPELIAQAIRNVARARQAAELPERAERALERAEREFSISALAERLAQLI
jgi:glycosyltransferase involved in cell wall biosynthesis